jgi:hypothetical protein
MIVEDEVGGTPALHPDAGTPPVLDVAPSDPDFPALLIAAKTPIRIWQNNWENIYAQKKSRVTERR